MKSFAVFLDGALQPTERLKQQLFLPAADGSGGGRALPAIAADGGIRHAAALGITPQLWLGDFDSAEPALQSRFAAVPQQRFPAEKDKTDGELAAAAAIKRGAERLIFCGAFGGARPDHALLHINLAIALRRKNIHSLLTDGKTEGTPLIKGNYTFDWPRGTVFSLIGGSAVSGLTIRGAKWNLENRTLPFGSSLALSNESCGRVHISIAKGYGILLAQLTL